MHKLINLLLITIFIFPQVCANDKTGQKPNQEYNYFETIGIRVVDYQVNHDLNNHMLRITGKVEIINKSTVGIYGHGFYRVVLKCSNDKDVKMKRSEDEAEMVMKPYAIKPDSTRIQPFDGYLDYKTAALRSRFNGMGTRSKESTM
jgi:hypothetical protein